LYLFNRLSPFNRFRIYRVETFRFRYFSTRTEQTRSLHVK
jgi:hypothetical protein